MKTKLLIALALIVLIPLGMLGWLGVRVAVEDQAKVRQNLRQLLTSRLTDIKHQVGRSLDLLEVELLKGLDKYGTSVDRLQILEQKNDLVRQVFWIDNKERLIHPNPKGTLSTAEKEFLARTRPIWQRKAILPAPRRDHERLAPRKTRGKTGDSILDLAVAQGHGWIAWYWAEGMHLLFWKRRADGGIVGAEVDRIVLMSRVVGDLPDSADLKGRIVLNNSRGTPIYQWGDYNPAKKEAPLALIWLRSPLTSWNLLYYGPQSLLTKKFEGRLKLNLAVILLVIAAGLLALAFYLYREYSRELREAARRVNFVTQVSHELKTPLTNIRLYAELLENRIDPEDDRGLRHLGVIVGESQRLTRLIQNILTFSKNRKGTLSINPVPTVLDDVVQRTLEQFKPTLNARGIDVLCETAAPQPLPLDPDAAEQILGNLLSNVEKYAASGKRVSVKTEQNAEQTTLTVTDNGPGIPAGLRKKIFEPFVRGSNKLSDGVTGTGIGLSIARELARLQGGELTLDSGKSGSSFRLILKNREGAA